MFQDITRSFVICASIIFCVLYTIITYTLYGSNDSKLTPIDLLESPRTVVFGTSKFNSDNLEIHTSDIGVALVLFSVSSFKAKEYSHLKLAIEGLPNNYQTRLVFVTLENPRPTELSLLQAKTFKLINLLSLNDAWQGTVKQVGLRILPHTPLGLPIQNTQPIIIKTAVLSNYGYSSNYFTLFNYWTNYEPWNYRSINHLQTLDLLPIYAHPIVFIILWLTLSGIICFFWNGKSNILLLIFMAWIFLELIFLQNTSEKVVWSKKFHSSKKISYHDQNLYELAVYVKLLLGLEDDKIKSNKVFIVSANNYHKLRLVYHMLPANSSFLNANIANSKSTSVVAGTYIVSYNLRGAPIAAINNILTFNDASVKVKEIASSEHFVIMQVVND